MNTPNPLVPQGSLQSRGKSTVRIAFFTIAAIHVVFIGGLLMQGCKKSEDKPVAVEDTNALPPLPPIDMTDTNAPAAPPTDGTAAVASNPPPVDVAPPPVVDVAPQPPVVAPESGREYVVTKGDSFSSIAKKMGVSVKSIEQANPSVNSSRLKIGQKLQIPASSGAPAPSASSAEPASSSGGTRIYTVKAGDMLEKIARRNGTTAKTIMRLNNLKTTMIKTGQKLKLPAGNVSAPASTTSPSYVTPLPTVPPAPVGTNNP